MVPRLEALADALIENNGSRDPASVAYRARNPLYLYSFDREGKQDKLRDFATFQAGYMAAVHDLKLKCSGRTRLDLHSHDLLGLVRVFSLPDITASKMAKFLQTALNDRLIHAETRLEYFLL